MELKKVGMQEPYNISIYPGTGTVDGIRGDHVQLCPPYTVKKSDIEIIVDITAKVIEDFFLELDV